MKESKINIDPKALTEEELSRSQNFAEVLDRYKKATGDSGNNGGKGPFSSPSGWWFAGGIALIVTVALVLLKNSEEIHAEVEAKREIIAPIESMEVPMSSYTLDAETGGNITHNGTTILVPENAFTDGLGNLITGEVELKYREYHTLTDIFLGGIPMQYDSAGTNYTFESAGMFEINAYQNGKKLRTNPSSMIEVQMASRNDGDYFNKYYFNEETGNWEYISKDDATITSLVGSDTLSPAGVKSRLAEIRDNMARIDAMRPKAPAKIDPELFSIRIKFDKDQFPELKFYGNVLFQVLEDNNDPEVSFRTKYDGVEWDDVTLEKEGSHYLLTFYKDMEPHKFKAKPVMDDASYSSAMIDFEAKYLAYEKRYSDIKKADSVEYAMLKSRAKKMVDSTDNINYLNSEAYVASQIGWKQSNRISRAFSIREFGIYNCDFPKKLPRGRMLAIDCFINKQDKNDTLDVRSMHLADHADNVLISLGVPSGSLEINPWNRTTFFLLTNDNKIAIFYNEDFENLEEAESYDLAMGVFDFPEDQSKLEELLKI